MLFAQVGWRRGIGGPGFEKIEHRVADAQGYHVVSSLGFGLLLHGQTQTITVEGLHRCQVSGDQGEVVKAFVGEHRGILADFAEMHLKK